MVKKKEKNIEEHAVESSGQYEKLRDEMFQYRVEIQSFKHSMKTIWISISIGFAL